MKIVIWTDSKGILRTTVCKTDKQFITVMSKAGSGVQQIIETSLN